MKTLLLILCLSFVSCESRYGPGQTATETPAQSKSRMKVLYYEGDAFMNFRLMEDTETGKKFWLISNSVGLTNVPLN